MEKALALELKRATSGGGREWFEARAFENGFFCWQWCSLRPGVHGRACAGVCAAPGARGRCAGAAVAASATHPLPSCVECSAPPTSELAAAIEARVADLKARGGECEQYGIVLEDALVSGRIAIRPYMWRVQGNLASAQGESSGEMTIARDIDSLNVGVRGLDEVLRSAEHEAAHIAFRIQSGDAVREARVDEQVSRCREMPPQRR